VSGIVFEALNNAGYLKPNLLVILNDNKMSICPRVGALAASLDRCRMSGFYTGSKRPLTDMLAKIPLVGEMAHRGRACSPDSLKPITTDGMLAGDPGLRYYGPVNAHDSPSLPRTLQDVKHIKGPVLLHVFTEKGHGAPQASAAPVTFHPPPVFEK